MGATEATVDPNGHPSAPHLTLFVPSPSPKFDMSKENGAEAVQVQANDGKQGGKAGPSIKLYFTQRKHQTTTDTPLSSKRPSQVDEQARTEVVKDGCSVTQQGDVTQFRAVLERYCGQENASKIEGLFEDKLSSIQDDLKISDLQRAPIQDLFIRLVQAEVSRLQDLGKQTSSIDFSVWLGNEVFVDSLVTCYLVLEGIVKPGELVPRSSFDVLMLIETVLKHAPRRADPDTMAKVVRWEERLLTRTVWSEPCIYKLIELEIGRQKQARNRSAVLDSPRKAIASMTSAAPSGTRLSRLELFFRKYFRLVVRYLDQLSSGLGLDTVVQDALWQAFLGLVEQVEPAERILQRRHLFQVLAALTYGVCRFYDKPVTFKQIIGVLEPPADCTQLYKAIWMGEGEQEADLVTFYNRIFLPAAQRIIHSLPSKEESEVTSPRVATVPASPLLLRTPKNKRRLADESTHSQQVPPQPSLHSPVLATSFLSKRIQLDQSPMKYRLSRHIASTGTPTKLLVAASEAVDQDVPSGTTATVKPAVARRLDF